MIYASDYSRTMDLSKHDVNHVELYGSSMIQMEDLNEAQDVNHVKFYPLSNALKA